MKSTSVKTSIQPSPPVGFMPAKVTPQGQRPLLLRLHGTDEAIGHQRGRELSEDLRRMWEWMEPRLSTVYGLPTAKWDEVAAASERNLQAVIPWMQAQLAGMAAGSGLPMRDLLLMNNYGLIWDGNWCSSVAVRKTDEGPLLGQNLDLGSEDFYYLEEIHADGAPAVLSERMVGMCHSCCGVNAAGLAVASSNLPAPGQKTQPWDWKGVSYNFVVAVVLRDCGTVAEGVQRLQTLPPTIPSGGGYQLNLLDATGAMALVDKTGHRTVVRQCEDGLNFTTNCTLDAEMERWRMGHGESYPDGVARANRIRAEWRQLGNTPPTREWLRRLLVNSQGDGCLCRTNERGYTRLSFIFSPVKRTMDATNGPPDRTAYERFEFTSA